MVTGELATAARYPLVELTNPATSNLYDGTFPMPTSPPDVILTFAVNIPSDVVVYSNIVPCSLLLVPFSFKAAIPPKFPTAPPVDLSPWKRTPPPTPTTDGVVSCRRATQLPTFPIESTGAAPET